MERKLKCMLCVPLSMSVCSQQMLWKVSAENICFRVEVEISFKKSAERQWWIPENKNIERVDLIPEEEIKF